VGHSDKGKHQGKREPHGLTRDRVRGVVERRLAQAGWAHGWVAALLLPLMLVLVDRTGQGTHAAWCGRDHLAAELARRGHHARWRGTLREVVGRRTVDRVLFLAWRLDLIEVIHRWDDTALRFLSASVRAELGLIARQRRKRPPRGPTPEEMARRNAQSQAAAEAAEVIPPAPVAAPQPGVASTVRAIRERLRGPPGGQ